MNPCTGPVEEGAHAPERNTMTEVASGSHERATRESHNHDGSFTSRRHGPGRARTQAATRHRPSSSTRAIGRIEKVNGEAERGDPPAVRPGPHRRAERAPDRALHRGADRRQGSRRHARRCAVPRGQQGAEGRELRRHHDQLHVREARARRLRHRRQDEHAGVRTDADGGAAGVRTDAQPVEPRAQQRRIERRFRGRGRERHGPRRRTRATAAARSASPRACAGCSG